MFNFLRATKSRTKFMSTFDGTIREYPCISVDYFRPKPLSAIFLLSHCHTDHMQGLNDTNFRWPIYCSPVSAKILLSLRKRKRRRRSEQNLQRTEPEEEILMYAHLQPYLVSIPIDEPTAVKLPNGQHVLLTLLPANHCPGSIMFLIEGTSGNVLYTGDLRAENWFIEGIQRNPFLSAVSIDTLYLDTSFCDPAFAELPTKETSVVELIKALKQEPLHTFYLIESCKLGCEEVIIGVSRAFNCKIAVSLSRAAMYESFYNSLCTNGNRENIEYVFRYITTDLTSTRFHACEWCERCCELNDRGKLVRIKCSTMKWRDALLEHARGLGETSRQLCILTQSSGQKSLLFSMHSSLKEIRSFVKMVCPRRLHACVLGDGESSRRILDLLKDCVSCEDHAPSSLNSEVSVAQQSDAEIARGSVQKNRIDWENIHSDTTQSLSLPSDANFVGVTDTIDNHKPPSMESDALGDDRDENLPSSPIIEIPDGFLCGLYHPIEISGSIHDDMDQIAPFSAPEGLARQQSSAAVELGSFTENMVEKTLLGNGSENGSSEADDGLELSEYARSSPPLITDSELAQINEEHSRPASEPCADGVPGDQPQRTSPSLIAVDGDNNGQCGKSVRAPSPEVICISSDDERAHTPTPAEKRQKRRVGPVLNNGKTSARSTSSQPRWTSLLRKRSSRASDSSASFASSPTIVDLTENEENLVSVERIKVVKERAMVGILPQLTCTAPPELGHHIRKDNQ
ncbi:beta-lactamase-like protein, partial [Cladochytrium replicatum]